MRCFTVLLACGWLLLMAPKKPDGSVDPTRPISEWDQAQFFDSAKDCYLSVDRAISGPTMGKWAQGAKRYMQNKMALKEAIKKAGKDVEAELRTGPERLSRARRLTRCIPSDLVKFPLK